MRTGMSPYLIDKTAGYQIPMPNEVRSFEI